LQDTREGKLMDYEKLMKKARKKNAQFDQVDAGHGHASPQESGLLIWLDTAEAAIQCGIKIGDWATVAEGLAMLQDAIANLNKTEVSQ